MAAQLRKSLLELSSQDKQAYFDLQRRIQCHKRTKEFRWKAADFIAKNILPTRTSSVIQCNLLEGRKEDNSVEKNVCSFCKCILAETCHSRLLPRKVQGSKLRNLLRRAQTFHNANGAVRFSKYELSLLKKCKLKPANTLVTACSVCHKSQKYPLSQWAHVPKPQKPVAKLKETRLKEEKIVVKKKINSSAGGQLLTTAKPESQKATLSNSKKKKLSMAALPGKTKSVVKEVPTQQKFNKNKSLAKLKGKVAKNKGTPEFIKKFKKGGKLASLIVQDEASKLKEKNDPKSNIFALLHSWVGK